MTPATYVADILAAGAVRPGPVPVTRPAPAAVAQELWSAYRLDEATQQSLSPPERIKRMGRGQEMAIGAVKRAMDSCSSAEPPARGSQTAVSVGTAWAEEGDEIVFLENLIKLGEKAAKPAYFVNSVKNALASQLALTFGFQGENQTFAHDALSFESALWQGAHLLSAGRARHAIVCGVEALVEFQEIHGHLLGWYGTDPAPLAPLAPLAEPSAHKRAAGQGSLPGEGAAAFVLTAPGTVTAPLARLVGVRARGPLKREPALAASSELAFIEQALRETSTRLDEIGLVLMGANGDPALDGVYAEVAQGLRALAPGTAIGVYRHLTGDFATASALGFELAVRAVAGRTLPSEVRVVAGAPGPIEHVLLYHVTSAGYHSTMIVSA
jgi:3-oxoacyl-(acyl-carrier-protein) synthase